MEEGRGRGRASGKKKETEREKKEVMEAGDQGEISARR